MGERPQRSRSARRARPVGEGAGQRWPYQPTGVGFTRAARHEAGDAAFVGLEASRAFGGATAAAVGGAMAAAQAAGGAVTRDEAT